MKKKYTIQGTADINGKEKDFTFEYENLLENEENNETIAELMDHPWQLLFEGGKFGVKGIKRSIAITLLFSIANFVLFLYATFLWFSSNFELEKLAYLGLVWLIGTGITVYAVHRSFQFVALDCIRVIYKNLASLFQKICSILIDKAAEVLSQNEVELSDKALEEALDFNTIIQKGYPKLSRFFRKGIVFVLSKIPFIGILIDLREDISNGQRKEASAKLFKSMDTFIIENIFGSLDFKWALWLFPLNVVGLVFLIHYLMG